MQKILITGGCGFIGSNFIHYFIEKHPETEVVNLDKLTYAGRKENLQDIENSDNYTFIKGDICNQPDAAKAMQGCTAVINFAAESHVDRAIADADSFVKTNFFGVKVLCEEARKQGIERFVQISTDEVMGEITEGSFKETDALHPRNPYSAAKAAGELLAMSYHSTYGLPVIATRSSNNFGPFQFPEKVIPLFITNLLQNKKVPLYGEGKNVRDWIYVMDNCEAIDLVLQKGKAGEIYNIAGGNELQNIQLTKMILAELGRGEEMIERVKDRPGHDLRYSLDFGKIKKELGWKPRTAFKEGLHRTVQWYKENEKWWKQLVKE